MALFEAIPGDGIHRHYIVKSPVTLERIGDFDTLVQSRVYDRLRGFKTRIGRAPRPNARLPLHPLSRQHPRRRAIPPAARSHSRPEPPHPSAA